MKNNIYIPKYFKGHELVHPYYWEKYGLAAIRFTNQKLNEDIDTLRTMLGDNHPIKINDYNWGGKFKNSGLRCPWYPLKKGAKDSFHYFGAYDLKVKGMKPVEVCNFILENDACFKAITRIEDTDFTPTWCHIDSKPINSDFIRLFKP